MPTGNNTSNIKSLKIFYFATVIGVVLFAVIILSIARFSQPPAEKVMDYADFRLILASVLAVFFFVVARNSYSRKTTAIRNSSVNISEKLNLYRTALISYISLCEAPALLALVLFLTSNNYLLLVVSGIMILVMASKFPSRERLIADMSLDGSEQQELV